MRHVVEPRNEVYERTLARAGLPHDADDLARPGVEGDPLEHGLARLEAKRHVLEPHLAPRALEVARPRAVLDIGPRVKDLEDPLRRGQRARDLSDEEPEAARGPDEAGEVIVEGDDRPHCQRTVDGEAAAVPDHDHASQ